MRVSPFLRGPRSLSLVLAAFALFTLQVPARPAQTPRWLTGVNISGGELNSARSRLHFDYTYPSPSEIRHFAAKGFRVFRIPVLSTRLIGRDGAVTSDWSILMGLIAVADQEKAFVVLDLHQYGSMPSGLVGRDPTATADFAQTWSILATRLKNSANVIFGLMNEPNKQSVAEWRLGAEVAIAAIRKTGAKQLILVPGTAWDGAHSWLSSGNAAALADIADPAQNLAFEVHQYLDGNNSGTHPEVIAGAGATRLDAATRWAREHKARLFLGEFGFAATPQAMAEGEALLARMKDNRDVWLGWTYWAAGPWWGDYMFSVEPGKAGDKPQVALLEKYK